MSEECFLTQKGFWEVLDYQSNVEFINLKCVKELRVLLGKEYCVEEKEMTQGISRERASKKRRRESGR